MYCFDRITLEVKPDEWMYVYQEASMKLIARDILKLYKKILFYKGL